MSAALLWLYGEKPAKMMSLPGTLARSLGFLECLCREGLLLYHLFHNKHIILSLVPECLMGKSLLILLPTIVFYVSAKEFIL